MDFFPDPSELGIFAAIVPLTIQVVIVAAIWVPVRRRNPGKLIQSICLTAALTIVVDACVIVFLFIVGVIVFRLANPSLI